MNEEIIQNINERLDKAIHKGRKIIDDEDLQQQLEDLKNSTEERVRKNPVKSVLIGFAIGFVAAKILNSD
ncbi:MAG: hypothetical protein FH748_08505 [Balneolaceae bacterium]|nr:hypothetical protein [Balneolaceae bacterium]